MTETVARVVAVACDSCHNFSKQPRPAIWLIEGLGVEGDAHWGRTVQHRSRIAVDPDQPNLRQVHLLPIELFGELAAKGFLIDPGQLGENVTTEGIDLVRLPRGARLLLGDDAVIEITGLRNPCDQIEAFHPGLLAELVSKSATGEIERRAGVMSIVLRGGLVRQGAPIAIEFPPEPHHPLERV